MPITPDTKDWTWAAERPCLECGFDASLVDASYVPHLIRENAAAWPYVLERDDAAGRPDDETWSPLEYAAHVRDVFRISERRFSLMLEHDDPEFENWDQDVTAVEERYAEQDPATVAREVLAEGEALAALLDAVPDWAWQRRGFRTDGSAFTVDTLARYVIHDPVHHLHDVRG